MIRCFHTVWVTLLAALSIAGCPTQEDPCDAGCTPDDDLTCFEALARCPPAEKKATDAALDSA